jgi:two-component sensor histidine kinase
MKYAFHNPGNGKIVLTMRKNNGHCFLEVRDTGAGFPDNFSIDTSGTLGMTLVKNLVLQLRGTLHFFNDGGAVFCCEFPSGL